MLWGKLTASLHQALSVHSSIGAVVASLMGAVSSTTSDSTAVLLAPLAGHETSAVSLVPVMGHDLASSAAF